MLEYLVVDVRGTACPIPVVRTRDAMKSVKPLSVLVSQKDQVDNVSRMAMRSGWNVTHRQERDYHVVELIPSSAAVEPVAAPEDLVCSLPRTPNRPDRRLAVIASETMGRGDDRLGVILMKAYINTLKDLDRLPDTIIFYNGGVRLAVDDSPVLEALKELEEAGVEILVCGTCLDFFGLKDRLGVGVISNMFDIAGALMAEGISVIA
ncbi:sulfurtransferase-like selenium metabolism protein YedF [bacterium]|nr:sulfurtransferase-like selenium metabolism protein YedF [candidate division CSSED10-310 bacterium]